MTPTSQAKVVQRQAKIVQRLETSPARRWFLQCALASVLTCSIAWGGSYLTRAALLVQGAERDAEALRRRLTDKDLAEVVHRVAVARVAAAREMTVPKDVVPAHPHVLLVLEAYERAADGALRSDSEAFLVALARARSETVTLRSVLKQLGWELPDLG